MAFDHNQTSQVTVKGRTIVGTVTKTAANANSYDESIAIGATDIPLTISIDKLRMVSFFMVANQALEIKTNSVGTPQEEIDLKANDPLQWHKGGNQRASADYPVNPFSGDVTAMFITNGTGVVVRLRIEILQDPTP